MGIRITVPYQSNWLRGIVLSITFGVLLFSGNVQASSSIIKIPKVINAVPGKPVNKLQVIATVTAQYKGRIVSIRKKPSKGPNCHHVKMILTDGAFLTFHVACKG